MQWQRSIGASPGLLLFSETRIDSTSVTVPVDFTDLPGYGPRGLARAQPTLMSNLPAMMRFKVACMRLCPAIADPGHDALVMALYCGAGTGYA